MIKLDETTWQQAYTKATGAEIHDVRGFLGHYSNCVWLANEGSSNRDYWRRKAGWALYILRKYTAGVAWGAIDNHYGSHIEKPF